MRASLIRFTGWSTKMFLFFFGNNFYKNKEIFKIFSPQLLEVYRIILVKTTLESIMFYYTFSVINTMYDPCTGLLYDSTAATWTLKLSITLLSISCRIHVISLLMMSSLVCRLFSQTLSRHLISQTEHLNTSGITSHATDSFCIKPITPGHPIPKMSRGTDWLFTEGVPERQSLWKQSTDKRGHHQKRNQTDCTRNA